MWCTWHKSLALDMPHCFVRPHTHAKQPKIHQQISQKMDASYKHTWIEMVECRAASRLPFVCMRASLPFSLSSLSLSFSARVRVWVYVKMHCGCITFVIHIELLHCICWTSAISAAFIQTFARDQTKKKKQNHNSSNGNATTRISLHMTISFKCKILYRQCHSVDI